MKSIVYLYTAWNEAEVGQGYDVKAAAWRAKLEEESMNKYDSGK